MQEPEPELSVRITVNGELVEESVPPRLLLTDFLRHTLGLTGTHVGCEHGVCGACTVLIDGRAARACLAFAVQCQGRNITTIEGISPDDGGLDPVQHAFRDAHGLQCGFCTPGFVMAITGLLREGRPENELTDREIREELAGNLCRCTGYAGIVAAARAVLYGQRPAGPSSVSPE